MARMNVLRKSYVMPDGSTRRSAHADATALRLEVLNGKDADGNLIVAQTINFDPASVNESIRKCAMLHGFSQKIGDEVAGAQGKAEKAEQTFGPDFVAGLLTDVIENLTGGVWVEEGEGSSGGSNVTILFEGILAAFEDNGTPIREDKHDWLRAKLANKEERDKFRANPAVAAKVAKITADRAVERAKAAAAKAKEAKGQKGGALAGLEV